MQTYGGMQFRTLFKRILGRFAKGMKGMKAIQTQDFSDGKSYAII
jgi:hypothetical protein